MLTPIKQVSSTEKYHLASGEVRIMKVLWKVGDTGLSFTEIKRDPSTKLSDTAISHFVKRLQRYNYILRGEHGKYNLTRLGFLELAHRKDRPISADELNRRRKKDFDVLWNETSRLHERVLRLVWLPGADQSSRLFMKAFGGGPGLVLVGALRTKDGKPIFKFKTLSPEELEQLGYVYASDTRANPPK